MYSTKHYSLFHYCTTLAEKVAQSMSPLAILGGKSVAEVFSNLLQGTILANVLDNNDSTDIVKAEEV